MKVDNEVTNEYTRKQKQRKRIRNKQELVGNMRKLPKVQILSGSTDNLIKS